MCPPWFLLALAAVTSATHCGIDPDNTFPSQGVTLKLLKRSWPTHQLVTEVAAILLSEALKYDIQIVEPDEVKPVEDPQQIAQGRFDANFELWPQGKSKELKAWSDDGPAVVKGGHYVLAHSGIYTMKYTVEKWPEAAFYQHLQRPQNSIYDSSPVKGQASADPQRLCATAEWNCSDFTWAPPKCRSNASACWGQVLGSQPSYIQGQIEQQIANNALGLQVAYLTPKALATHVWDAFATRKHLLFYSSQPSEGFFGISDDNFVPVAFPPEGSGCNSSYSTVPTGNFSCQISGQALLKVVSPKFQGSSDAARFAALFSLNEADFQELLTTWRLYGDARAAACAWLHHTGQKRWGNWILFTKRIQLVDSFPPTQGCFPHFYVFAGLAIVLFIVTRVFSMLMHWKSERQAQKKAAQKDPQLTSDLEHLQWQMHSRACKTHVDLTSKLIGSSAKQQLVAVKWALLKGRMNFMSFFRSEEDFCQPLGQSMAPPDASSALRQYYHTKVETLVYVCTSGFAKTCISALVYTCAAGAVGALLSEVQRVAELNQRVDPVVPAQELLTTWRLYGDARAAACAWLHHTGQKRWGNWILFTKRIQLVDSFPPTQGCFPHFYVFAGLAIVLFIVTRVFSMLMHWKSERQAQKKAAQKDPQLTSDLEHLQWQMHSRACKTHVDLTSKLIGSSAKQQLVAVKWALLKGRMNFMSFFRSEEDFCQPLGQSMAPPDASSALRQYYHTKVETLVYVCTSGFAKTCISALVYTCAAGAVGALLSEVQRVAELNQRVDPVVPAQEQYSRFLSSMETVNLVVQGFDFLPVFLITYMIGQDVNRWHEWLQKMLQVQGRLHDLVIIVNSSYRKVNDQVNAATERKAIFKWYRYLNAIHYLNYLNLVPIIGSAEQAMHDLETVGLLTHAECEKLRFSTGKVRDTVTSWLGRYWHEELEAGHVQHDETKCFMQKLCDLRAILAGLNDMPSKAPPQVVRMMMVIVTNTLLVLALLGYPSKMYKDTNACIQFWPLLACFLYCVCYRGMLHVMFILDKGPFYAKGECVNVDALLTSTERFSFHVFRNPFEKTCERPACGSPQQKCGGLSLSPK